MSEVNQASSQQMQIAGAASPQQRAADLNRLHTETVIKTLTEQRDNALNQVVNLTAEKAILGKAHEDAIEKCKGLAAIIQQQQEALITAQGRLLEQQTQVEAMAQQNGVLQAELIASTQAFKQVATQASSVLTPPVTEQGVIAIINDEDGDESRF